MKISKKGSWKIIYTNCTPLKVDWQSKLQNKTSKLDAFNHGPTLFLCWLCCCGIWKHKNEKYRMQTYLTKCWESSAVFIWILQWSFSIADRIDFQKDVHYREVSSKSGKSQLKIQLGSREKIVSSIVTCKACPLEGGSTIFR